MFKNLKIDIFRTSKESRKKEDKKWTKNIEVRSLYRKNDDHLLAAVLCKNTMEVLNLSASQQQQRQHEQETILKMEQMANGKETRGPESHGKKNPIVVVITIAY